MKIYISNEDTNLIAAYDDVLYEYHDGSWHEIEFHYVDDNLSSEFKSLIPTSVIEVRVLNDVARES